MSDTTDQIFCIFCEDVRHEANGLLSVMGWLGSNIQMPPTGPLVLPKLCAVVSCSRKSLEPIKSLRVTIRIDDKVLQEVSPTPEVLKDMQLDTLRDAEQSHLRGLSFKFNMQMLFFRVDEPGTLRAYAEIDGKSELASQGLRFVRPT